MISKYRKFIRKKKFYLVTITAVNNRIHIEKFMIDLVKDYIKDHGFEVTEQCYELGATYRQLHWHGIGTLSGRYAHLTKYEIVGFKFQIRWSPVHDMEGAKQYIDKDKHYPSVFINLCKRHYFNIDTQSFPHLSEQRNAAPTKSEAERASRRSVSEAEA